MDPASRRFAKWAPLGQHVQVNAPRTRLHLATFARSVSCAHAGSHRPLNGWRETRRRNSPVGGQGRHCRPAPLWLLRDPPVRWETRRAFIPGGDRSGGWRVGSASREATCNARSLALSRSPSDNVSIAEEFDRSQSARSSTDAQMT